MKAHHIRQAMVSERVECIVGPRHRQSSDGKGVLVYEFVGKTLETSKLVKRPTLLGHLLARVGALPVLPKTPVKRRPGPKPRLQGGIGVVDPDIAKRNGMKEVD